MSIRRRDAAIQERRRLLIERSYTKKLRREFARMSQQVQEDYEAGGEGRAIIGMDEHRDNLQAILGELYWTSLQSAVNYLNEKFGKRFNRRIEAKADSVFDDDAELGSMSATSRLMAFFRSQALKFATTIAATSKETVKRSISALVEEGAGEGEIAKQIRGKVDGLSVARSRAIARTETLMAVNSSQYDVVQDMELPPFKNEWNASLDGRTREDHRAADGQLRDPGQHFSIGGEQMLYPGDRSGGPAQVINCRCVLTQVFDDDED